MAITIVPAQSMDMRSVTLAAARAGVAVKFAAVGNRVIQLSALDRVRFWLD